MKKDIIRRWGKYKFFILGLGVLLAGWGFVHHQRLHEIRTHLVSDYLGVAQGMSSFMMETSLSSRVTRPSLYSLEVLFQKHLNPLPFGL